jgi:uncharacterized membrane protein (DUF485 family)
MPFFVQCHGCGKELRIRDDLLGRKVRCPVCQSVFMTARQDGDALPGPGLQPDALSAKTTTPVPRPAFEPPTAPVDELGEPDSGIVRRRQRHKPIQRANWQKVRLGLTLLIISWISAFVLMVMTFVVAFIYLALNADVFQETGPPANLGSIEGPMPALVIMASLVNVVIWGIEFAGKVLLVWAPEKHIARVLAIVLLSLTVLHHVFHLLEILIPPVKIVGALIGVLELFTLLLFLRAVALCLQKGNLQDLVRQTLFLVGAATGFFIAIFVPILIGAVALPFMGKSQEGVAGVGIGMGLGIGTCFCFDLVLILLAVIWYLRALFQARSEIGRYLDRQ